MLIVISSRIANAGARLSCVGAMNNLRGLRFGSTQVLTLLFTSGIVIDAARCVEFETGNDIPRGCMLAGIKVAWYKRATAEKSYRRSTAEHWS